MKSGVETRFVRDGDRIIQERDASNNLLEEYFWDGGRLFKQGTGANSRFPQAQISGTPERWTDTSGEFTGGSLFSRSGQPVESYNDAQLRVGWGGERKYPVPGLYGSYWAYLHRPFNGPSPGFQVLPFLGFPTAGYQGILGTNNQPYLPPGAQRILAQTNASMRGASPTSVDNDWRGGMGATAAGEPPPVIGVRPTQDCVTCLANDDEGTLTVVIGGGSAPQCDSKEALVPTVRVHIPPGGCIKACKAEGGGYTYEALKPGDWHCRNAKDCCPVSAFCDSCEIPGQTCKGGETTWDLALPLGLGSCWQQHPALYKCCCNNDYGTAISDSEVFGYLIPAIIQRCSSLPGNLQYALMLLMQCIARRESTNRPAACSSDCGLGLFQLTPPAWPSGPSCEGVFTNGNAWDCENWSNSQRNTDCAVQLVCNCYTRRRRRHPRESDEASLLQCLQQIFATASGCIQQIRNTYPGLIDALL